MSSQQDILVHYDDNPILYRQFLGETMMYSCGIWQNADTLDQAQIAKIDYHLNAMEVNKNTSNIIDLGSGWGGFCNRLHIKFPSVHLTGLTLSPTQADYSSVTNTNCRFEVADARSYSFDKIYDCAVSIGALEHFSNQKEWRKGKHILTYKNFFRNAKLNVKGVLSLQTIFCKKQLHETKDVGLISYLRFMYKHIFPNSLVPPLSDILVSVEEYYHIESIRTSSEDYYKTIRHWQNNLNKNSSEIPKNLFEQFDKYFELTAKQFEKEHLGICQLKLVPRKG